MRLLTITLLAMALTGCATSVPVTARFPDSPGQLVSKPCPQLTQLKEDASLSDISRTIAGNYTMYYECAVKLDAWIEWYSRQKTIFEGAGK